MAINFLQKKKFQGFLMPVLGVFVFITAIVIWWGFFTTGAAPKEDAFVSQRSVEVDTRILFNPLLQKLNEPRAKTQIPSEVGRANPMLPSLQ